MTAQAIPAPLEEGQGAPTANDRFHESFARILWECIILATVLHLALFDLWPEMRAADISYSAPELTAIELPPEIEIPEAPKAIARPAVPVIATGDVDEDITIAPTTFESNPVTTLPPPPSLEESPYHDISEAPTFTPFTVRPEIKNRFEIEQTLEREYPPLLREAGIGGSVQVWFFLDESGKVVKTQVAQTSGHLALDQAALSVANIARFTPALNRDKRVPVWISLPITFATR